MKDAVPNSFQLFGNTITIERVPRLLELTGHFGEFIIEENIIRIDAGLNKEQGFITFVHEVTHAILIRAGITYTAVNFTDDNITESFVLIFSELFSQVLFSAHYNADDDIDSRELL
jgi:hypothetical protein